MSFIRQPPQISENKPGDFVGRYVTNALGVEEIVVLKQVQWDYLDWLESKGADIAAYICACDQKNPDQSLSDSLEWWIYWAYEDREKHGLPSPNWLNNTSEY